MENNFFKSIAKILAPFSIIFLGTLALFGLNLDTPSKLGRKPLKLGVLALKIDPGDKFRSGGPQFELRRPRL